MAHERVQLEKYNLEVRSQVFPEDTSRLHSEFISVSWYYTVENVGYYQFEIGTIESVQKDNDGNNRSVEVKYLREKDESTYPVTLDIETFAPNAGHIPGKQYEWRMLNNIEQHDDM